MSRYFPQKSSTYRVISLFTLLSANIFITSCSTGMRIKNLINYPTTVNSIAALDSLYILPDVVKYIGEEDSTYFIFSDDIRLQGKHDNRPVWVGGPQGSFKISNGADVHILDFNFRGTSEDSVLIQVENGTLVLENCDFDNIAAWAIHVGELGSLQLRNVRFSNLDKGAIKVDGGKVKIFDCDFDLPGEAAIQVHSGELFEAHRVTISGTMGTAIEFNAVNEVWLDSVRIYDSFKDGIRLSDCDFTLIENIVTNKNGRNGLFQNNTKISGLINFSAVGNLVNGIEMHNLDTLRIMNSEFVGNGESGAKLNSIGRSRMAGIVVAHNENTGLQIQGGNELFIHHSSFQANLKESFGIDSVSHVDISQIGVANNDDGVRISNFEEINFSNSVIKSNTGKGAAFFAGKSVNYSHNILTHNTTALMLEDVERLQLDTNNIMSNDLGTEFLSMGKIISTGNDWINNKSASYFSDIGSFGSTGDEWANNTLHAMEVLSAKDFYISKAAIRKNRDAVLLNQTSAKLESTSIDSSQGYALKLLNGTIVINESKIRSAEKGLLIASGSQAKVTQSIFENLAVAVVADPSTDLSLAFSTLKGVQVGVRLGEFAKAEIVSNLFDNVENYCIDIEGAHLQSLYIRQNVMSNSGGILFSTARSGKIEVINNTFASNTHSFDMMSGTLKRLDHNIFYSTNISNFGMLEDVKSFKWNCYFPDSLQNKISQGLNLMEDPLFDSNYFLKKESKCVNGGKNGFQIGALGILGGKRPELKP